MEISIVNKTRSRIDDKKVGQVVKAFLKNYKINKEVSIVFVGDHKIRALNKIYRNKDKVTDILSFDGDDESLGEIIIDYAQLKRQAKKYSKSVKDELIFILVHGLLHLIGYDDKAEKGRIEIIKKGEDFIKKNI